MASGTFQSEVVRDPSRRHRCGHPGPREGRNLEGLGVLLRGVLDPVVRTLANEDAGVGAHQRLFRVPACLHARLARRALSFTLEVFLIILLLTEGQR